jgi:hypothetical protein
VIRGAALLFVSLVSGGPFHATGMAQETYARFEIIAPSDTTFTLVLAEVRWVKRGMAGVVVDPRQRDEMVARFTISAVDEKTARASITGMTSGITELHMALLPVPGKPWFAEKLFWLGTALGAALGFFLGRG